MAHWQFQVCTNHGTTLFRGGKKVCGGDLHSTQLLNGRRRCGCTGLMSTMSGLWALGYMPSAGRIYTYLGPLQPQYRRKPVSEILIMSSP